MKFIIDKEKYNEHKNIYTYQKKLIKTKKYEIS